MDEQGRLKRNFTRPIIKDTFALPLQGYTIFRFIADNPGFWAIHCTMDSYWDTGMLIILKVGESKDLPPKPKDWPPLYILPSQNSDRRNYSNNLIHLFFLFLFIFTFFNF